MKKTNYTVTFKVGCQRKSTIENYEKMFQDTRTLGKGVDKSFYFHAANYGGLSHILHVVGEHKNYLYLLMRNIFALSVFMLIVEIDNKLSLSLKYHG